MYFMCYDIMLWQESMKQLFGVEVMHNKRLDIFPLKWRFVRFFMIPHFCFYVCS